MSPTGAQSEFRFHANLRRIAIVMCGVVMALVGLLCLLTPSWSSQVSEDRRAIVGSASVTLACMLIGLVPLQRFLRRGFDHMLPGTIAAMIVRMFGTVIGLAVLIRWYEMPLISTSLTAIVTYLLLIGVEVAMLCGQIRTSSAGKFDSSRNR